MTIDPPPKRALLSLKSVGVMCVVLAAFAWANARDRIYDIRSKDPELSNPLPRNYEPRTHVWRVCYRGFPWSHHQEGHEYLVMDDSGNVAGEAGPEWFPDADTRMHILLLNLAVALAVSIALALASERFVFSRMRSGREGEKGDS